MKRLCFRLGLALITFGLGVGAVWASLRVLRPSAPPGTVGIFLERHYRDEDGRIIAEFLVVNGVRETLYYQGYDDNDNQYWSVRRGYKTDSHWATCGTGLAERKLSPGESAKFQVRVGREGRWLRVGFDFSAGKKRSLRTVWSDNIYIPES